MRKKVTLADVAQRAGVSSTMVSYVLRSGEKGKSAPETRRKILNAVKELGYRVDYAARALRYGRNRTVGLVLPALRGYLYELMCALDLSFRKLDYTVICSFFARGAGSKESFIEAVERMYSMNVDAVITPTYLNVPKSNIPVIIWGNDRPDFDCVFPDKYAFGIEVVERLLSMGHRRIGIAGLGISGSSDSRPQEARYLGMQTALKEHGVFDPSLQAEFGTEQEDGEEVMDYFLSLPEQPSVIVCHSDELAIGTMRAAYLRGIRVPEQLSIVGFDHLPLASAMAPSLATYDQHFSRMAELLAEVTLNRINDPALPLQKRSVPVEFIPGESLIPVSKISGRKRRFFQSGTGPHFSGVFNSISSERS